MSFIGGYQSDVNLNGINYVGDFPIEHSIGGYGLAHGDGPGTSYTLTLTPAITQYRVGMPLAVSFDGSNGGAATLNVNNRGAKPIKKVDEGNLLDLELDDLVQGKIYLLIYDGAVFQVANSSHFIYGASETRMGIAKVATLAETFAGLNDFKFITPVKLIALINTLAATQQEVDEGIISNKAVTPLTLANYIADKITGLWEDKGMFSGAGNPLYPPGQVGDAYTVNIPGKIGGAFGQNIGVRDVIYCNTDNDGGDDENVGFCWTIIQANLDAATELIAGYLRIATQAEVNAGTSNTTAVSPLKLKTLLNTLIVAATEAQAGIAAIASTAEVNAGTDNTKFITPAKLAAYVTGKVTGLWDDKGTLDCSANPNYPAGLKGDAYTVSVAGKIGGAAGINVQVKDVIYCSNDNAGGSQAAVGASWNVIQSNLEQATQVLAGFARIATLAEATTGTDDSLIITPLKLASLLMFQAGAGSNAIIPKVGANNTAPGSHAAVLHGNNNRANNTFSTAIGSYADAWQFNEFAKSPGAFFNTQGSVQHSVLTIWNIIPSNGGIYPVNLDGGGSSASNRWRVPNNTLIHFMLQFSIVQNSGSAGTIGDTWTAIYEGVAKNVNGTISWVGGAPSVREIRQDAGLSPSVSISASGNEIIPIVIAIANKNLHANITAYITQTKFAL